MSSIIEGLADARCEENECSLCMEPIPSARHARVFKKHTLDYVCRHYYCSKCSHDVIHHTHGKKECPECLKSVDQIGEINWNSDVDMFLYMDADTQKGELSMDEILSGIKTLLLGYKFDYAQLTQVVRANWVLWTGDASGHVDFDTFIGKIHPWIVEELEHVKASHPLPEELIHPQTSEKKYQNMLPEESARPQSFGSMGVEPFLPASVDQRHSAPFGRGKSWMRSLCCCACLSQDIIE